MEFPGPTELPPVVLLHGIGSVNVLAAPLLPTLAQRRVFAIDWPGHGLSGPSLIPVTIQFRSYAIQTLSSILDELDLGVVDLVGHSLGAQISLYNVLEQDPRIRRVVLLGAPGASLQDTKPLAVMKLLALPKVGERLLLIPQSDKMFDKANDMALGVGALASVPKDLVEALRVIGGRRSNAASIAGFFRSLIKRGSLRTGVPIPTSELAAIKRPVLMVWGDQDTFLTPARASRSIAAIPDVRLVRVPDAGHAPWLQNPELVARAIAEHLNIDRTPEVRSNTMTNSPEPISFTGSDGQRIAAYRWAPEGTPRAIVQVTHGVGEYALRYAPLVGRLVDEGYVVYAHDHRGHGGSILDGAEPGALGEDGWANLVLDIGLMGKLAREAHPTLKLGLVAHSLGSFATQQFLLDHSEDVDAVALSGTASIDLLEPALDLDAPMDLGMFNAAFEPARTPFDWLTRDEHQVDLYIDDPQCGFGLDIAGGRDMFVAARQLALPERVATMRADLPVYVTVGDMDPVNGGLALVQALVGRYQAAGLGDVTLKSYAGARHEVFNETNRDEVFSDLIDWLAKALA
jgi:alpha-beta hydrolase superfamily lysophospholipase